MLTTIIYDSSEKNGHQAEYIDHLIYYLKLNSLDKNNLYLFVLHTNIIDYLSYRLGDFAESSFVQIVKIPDEVTNYLRSSNNVYYRYENSKIEGKYLSKIMDQFGANRIVFMALDYQFMLAGKKKIYPENCYVSGIYFRPLPAQVSVNRPFILRLIGGLKRIIKAIMIKWLTLNPAIDKIYVPEDKLVINWLTRYINPTKFKYLPDPIIQRRTLLNNNWRKKYNVTLTDPVFLVFGAMAHRKNILNIIQAFSFFKQTLKGTNARLLILGKFVTSDYKDNVLKAIASTCTECNDSIILDDRFAENSEIEQIFADCQAVLMPYVDSQGSSGVLGHSAKHRKPVIVANQGLVADLVLNYQLGYTVDPIDPSQIAEAMKLSTTYKSNELLIKSFLADRTPEAFASLVLQ